MKNYFAKNYPERILSEKKSHLIVVSESVKLIEKSMTHSDMGGFSKAPKFPQPVNFNFLFTYYAANPKDDRGKQGLKMALHTLDMMARGGIHDHISQVCTKPRTIDAQ